MGCYQTKEPRLNNEYRCWNTFISDLLAVYAEREASFTIRFNCTIIFNDAEDKDVVYTFNHCGLVNSASIQTMRLQLAYFRAVPYYYIDDYMYLYEHVDVCKLCSINIVIND
jgi:hypothetical protein